ncbi:MAG TPA: isopentenyl transferase family protein, partial [Bacteroidia bacterium]|nr:isopentenyl transferase family protein [Bacteroidia bacterium]
MSTGKKYLVVIAGPTGVGKTALAIQLAQYFNTEIISADSRQFYKETSIGTAKPSQEELNVVNTLSIHQNYSVGDFEKDVIKLLHELFAKHNIVFLVGGSGLYIDAVLYGVDEFIEVSEATRHFVKENYSQKGISWLQEEVKTKDPVYFSNVDQ